MNEEYLCPRCTADPQPPHFAKRACLFRADGSFSVDNWNCATEWALFEALRASVYVPSGVDPTVYGCDESLNVVQAFPHIDDPNEIGYGEPQGWLIFTRYKRRGRTSNVIWVGDFVTPPSSVGTLRDLVESTIRGLQARRRRDEEPQRGR